LELEAGGWLTSRHGYVPWLPLKRRLGKPQSSLDIFCPYQDLNPNHPAQNKSLYQLFYTSFPQTAKSPQEFE